MQHRRLPVRDELYLLAHDNHGQPRIHVPTMALALAAATVVDLVIAGRFTAVREENTGFELIAYRSVKATGDLIADSILTDIRDSPGRRPLRGCLTSASMEVYQRTGAWLHMAGVVSQRRKKRLLGEDTLRYVPLRVDYVRWLHSLLYQAVNINPQVDLQSAALCRLIALLRLETLSGVNLPATELVWRLGQPLELAGHAGPSQADAAAVVIVVSTVEAMIGELAVAVYR